MRILRRVCRAASLACENIGAADTRYEIVGLSSRMWQLIRLASSMGCVAGKKWLPLSIVLMHEL